MRKLPATLIDAVQPSCIPRLCADPSIQLLNRQNFSAEEGTRNESSHRDILYILKKRNNQVDLVNFSFEPDDGRRILRGDVAAYPGGALAPRDAPGYDSFPLCGSSAWGSAIRTRHFSQRKGKPWLTQLAKSDWFCVGLLSVEAQRVTVLRPTSVPHCNLPRSDIV